MKWGMSVMKSKISSFKRGMIVQDFRMAGWIGIIYLIALLYTIPLQIVMMHQADRLIYFIQNHNLFSVLAGLQILMMFGVPVLLAAVLFRYLQVKAPADFIHSLPIKRAEIFHHHALIGMFLLVVPVVITSIVIAIVHGLLNLDAYFSITDIFVWTGLTILMNVFVFSLSSFLGTVTGISALQVILTYIFLFFPAGITVLTHWNVKYFIYGFPYDYYVIRNIDYLTPVFRLLEIGTKNFKGIEIATYIGLTIVFYLLAIFAYKRRPIEAATQAIAFRYLKPVFKYGVTFCMMLLGGVYFGETQDQMFGWILFGYISGSLFGYVIAEVILQKTWRIFREMKGYAFYSVAVVAVAFLLSLDMTGFEKKLPDANAIEKVYFSDTMHWFIEKDEASEEEREPLYYYHSAFPHAVSVLEKIDPYFFEDKDVIDSVLKLHRQLIEDKNLGMMTSRNYTNVAIAYELKDGSKLVRQYRVPENAYGALLKPIYESLEYRYSNNDLLRLKEEITVDKIIITGYSPSKKFETVDPEQIKEILHALKTDMLTEPYEQMISKRESWADIELLLENNERLYVSWKKSYTHFDEWMKQNELLEKVRDVPADIDYALVTRNDERIKAAINNKDELIAIIKESPETVKIDDPALLEECLYEASWGYDTDYVVLFYYKNSNTPKFNSLANTPSFIK